MEMWLIRFCFVLLLWMRINNNTFCLPSKDDRLLKLYPIGIRFWRCLWSRWWLAATIFVGYTPNGIGERTEITNFLNALLWIERFILRWLTYYSMLILVDSMVVAPIWYHRVVVEMHLVHPYVFVVSILNHPFSNRTKWKTNNGNVNETTSEWKL